MDKANQKNKNCNNLLLVESIWSFGSGLFLPVFAIFTEQVGGDITDAGIAAGIFLFVTSTLEYPIGKLLDKYKEKWFITADYFMEALIFFGYIFVDNKYELFVLQIFLGVANAIGDPSWESLFSKSSPRNKSGSYWASSHLFVGYAAAASIILGSMAIDSFGFKTVFFIGGCFSLIAALFSFIRLKNQK